MDLVLTESSFKNRTDMKNKFSTWVVFVLSMLCFEITSGQDLELKGAVKDSISGETLIGVNIYVEGEKVRGTVTDFDGNYSFNVYAGDIVVFRYVGYRDKYFTISNSSTLDVLLRIDDMELNPIVVSASRKKEKILDAPASISLIDGSSLRKKVTTTAIDQIKNLAGVHIARTGIQGGAPSVRGLGGYYTGNLMTLVDNRIANLPSLRINAYSTIPTGDDDIDRVELLRGPASALYGPNTGEGVVHMITSSPLDNQETKVYVGFGVRSFIDDTIKTADKESPRFDNKEIKDRMIYMAGFRQADTIALKSEILKLGYRLSTRFFYGNDWKADDLNDPVRVIRYIPTADGIIPLKANGTPLTPEEMAAGQKGDEVDNERNEVTQRESLDGRLDLRIKEHTDIILSGGWNTFTGIDMSPIGVVQNRKWNTGYAQVRGSWKNLFAQFYMNSNNSGDTYFVPTGGMMIDKSKMYALQLQYWTPLKRKGKITYGVDGIFTRPMTDNTLNGRYEDQDNINEFGTYFQGDYEIIPRLTLLAAARLDYHNVVKKPFVSPRLALMYKPGSGQQIRLTYNRAFRTPGAGAYFIDVKTAEIPQDIEIRAQGTIDPFYYSFANNPFYDNQLLPQFKSPYGSTQDTYYHVGDKSINNDAWQGILGAIKEQFLVQFGQENNQLLQGLVDLMISSLAPSTIGDIDQVVRDLNSTSRSFVPNEEEWKKMTDVQELKNVTVNNLEAGYKGIIAKMLSLSADVYWTKFQNYLAPVNFITPAVMFDPDQLMGEVGPQIIDNLQDPNNQLYKVLLDALLDNNTELGGNNNGTGDDELLALIRQAVENLPIGVINPTSTNGPDMLLVSRNIGDFSVVGMELQATVFLNKDLRVSTYYSWVNKDSLDVEGASYGFIALNAPKHKVGLGVNYTIEKIGLSLGSNFSWQAGFPVNSGNFVGRVNPHHEMDVDVSWTPNFLPAFNATMSVSNIYNNVHQYFVGAPEIGLMALMRLSYVI